MQLESLTLTHSCYPTCSLTVKSSQLFARPLFSQSVLRPTCCVFLTTMVCSHVGTVRSDDQMTKEDQQTSSMIRLSLAWLKSMAVRPCKLSLIGDCAEATQLFPFHPSWKIRKPTWKLLISSWTLKKFKLLLTSSTAINSSSKLPKNAITIYSREIPK